MITKEQYDDNQPRNSADVQDKKAERPLGVTIVSAFAILLNLWFIIFTLISRSNYLAGYGRPPFMSMSLDSILTDIFIYAIYILVGFALWYGKTFGWWLCVLFWFYKLVVNSVFLLMLFIALFAPSEGANYIISNASLSVMSISVLALIILHFFENPSFAYFNLNTRLKFRYALYLIISAITIVVLQDVLQA